MPHFTRVSLLLALLCAGNPAAHAQAPSEGGEQSSPDWIWAEGQDSAKDVRFIKSLRLASAPSQASLGVAADLCDVVVQVNGQTVVQLESFAPTCWIDVAQFCVPGDNQLALLATPRGQPPAIALSLKATNEQGKSTFWRSDASWTAEAVELQAPTKVQTRSLGQVAKPMWGIGARPAKVSPFEDYTQWKRALADPAIDDSGRFWTRNGFQIELIQNAAADQGSWVALAFDQDGRLTIAREARGLLRFSFDKPGGKIVRMETIDDELLECRGLAYVNGDLYANANNTKALYRLGDLHSDNALSRSEVVREFPGGVGHGRNQLAVHGGALWSICGDAVDLPTDMFDRTSPFREARRGRTSREGFLARFDLQSRQWQLFCAGLRNPFGVAFHKDGEAFTYDADAEYDMGAPWYRPTRLLHLRSGADYGWRGVTGSWPPYDPDHPDNAQPLLDIGKGSPTAVAFGYASNFPSAFRDALYVLDWAYGRVLAVHLSPRGGTYRAQAETFLQGAPLNVTGIDFGPDGAMYLTTGGRKTKSALYRVRYVGPSAEEPPESLHRVQMKEQALAAVALRRQLETWHGRADLEDLKWAFQHLGSRDPSIRNAAQTALEHQPLDAWRNLVLDAEPSRSAMVGLLSLARSDANELARPVLQRLLQVRVCRFGYRWSINPAASPDQVHERRAQLRDEFRTSLLMQLDAYFPNGNEEALGVGPYGATVEVNRELSPHADRPGSGGDCRSLRRGIAAFNGARRSTALSVPAGECEVWVVRQNTFGVLHGSTRGGRICRRRRHAQVPAAHSRSGDESSR